MANEDATITEKENDQEIVRANATRSVVRSPTFASYYSNDVQSQVSPWDVRLQFGLIQEVDKEANRATIELMAEVRLSPQIVKRVLRLIETQLKDYEDKFGTIPLPRD